VSAESTVSLPAGEVRLAGELTVPDSARCVVLFAHGTGSSRLSPRNRYVAGVLQRSGLATLLLDLLTEAEELADQERRQLAFDIPLLAGRLVAAMEWLGEDGRTARLPIGLFGASTGAAAALVAAADRPGEVLAVVSRGGRPDLAGRALGQVRAPTLLLVGGRDRLVLELNRSAAEQLSAEHRIEVIDGATHLFEEPGALERVAELARAWFLRAIGPEPGHNGQIGDGWPTYPGRST
jgi:putative phosphoribosyl transferase